MLEADRQVGGAADGEYEAFMNLHLIKETQV